MSHLVSIKTQIRDAAALAAACRRLGLVEPVRETVYVFNDQVTGLAVRFPGWEYPVVVDVQEGTVRYDDFNGTWGDPRQLDQLMQSYAVERTKLEARKKGLAVQETALQDGSIKLQILEGA